MCEGLGLDAQIAPIGNKKTWIGNKNDEMKNMTYSEVDFKPGVAQNFVEPLSIMNDGNISLENKTGSKYSKYLPVVQSTIIYKICQMLDIEAELNPLNKKTFSERQNNQMKTKTVIPIVKSSSIFMFCQALGIDAKLDPLHDTQF
ncbi:hypothetical protein NPIL_415861 [Nephila pilipes]|uniref:Uncharacterized protein n=1 Tax=Nephila pilipes TaxID=299642 RepID=A0A8X6U9C4_NEPPI|nr:hypothetical protein NPIL_415861 [Nephila pilipes]